MRCSNFSGDTIGSRGSGASPRARSRSASSAGPNRRARPARGRWRRSDSCLRPIPCKASQCSRPGPNNQTGASSSSRRSAARSVLCAPCTRSSRQRASNVAPSAVGALATWQRWPSGCSACRSCCSSGRKPPKQRRLACTSSNTTGVGVPVLSVRSRHTIGAKASEAWPTACRDDTSRAASASPSTRSLANASAVARLVPG